MTNTILQVTEPMTIKQLNVHDPHDLNSRKLHYSTEVVIETGKDFYTEPTTLQTQQLTTTTHSNANDSFSKGRTLFGISLEGYSIETIVGIYTIGIFVTYISVFIIQESVFKYSEFEFGGLLTFFQFLAFSIMGFIQHVFFPEKHEEKVEEPVNTSKSFFSKIKRRAPMRFYFFLGLYSVIGTAASSYSLQLLNFPTWVLFKSSRVISVMIGGIFILGKRYTLKEYLGVLLLAIGLIIFTLGDLTLLPSFDPFGVLLVFLSLVMNSFEGNMQEKVMCDYKTTEEEVLFFGYGFGALQIFPYILLNGELVEGITFCYQNFNVLLQVGATCVLSYFGIVLVLGLVKISSALTAVIVTSCRKALTVVISFLLFAKPFSMYYPMGFVVFFAGVALNVYAKNSENFKVIIANLLHRKKTFLIENSLSNLSPSIKSV
eukprot:TRINITY_DN256_c0_g1_i2.p1 TRINITY_DN256_c0_g1~~TRINITY_DN256_c0_g1_i2.p1  ORF type:complete len:431 (+),score=59.80 TRINITY_DN256_c0_g1_i2:630-1922(+)